MRIECLVEEAGVAVEHKDVRVANICVGPSTAIGGGGLNGRGYGEGSLGNVAFAGVVDHVNGDQRSGAGVDDDIGDAVVAAGYGREIVMEMEPRESGSVGDGSVVRVERRRGNV